MTTTITPSAMVYVDGMAWATPQFSKTKVDNAARAFMNPATSSVEREEARSVINNWRSSHSFPLNTMQMNLRNRALKVDSDALIAQRIKRLPSIQLKLADKGNMRLTQMQDIGGCRAVVSDLAAVRRIVELTKKSRSEHELVKEDDYILEDPQASGYRSHHLVYRYKSPTMTTYNGLMVELQIRTRLQHAWATAVETVGTFTRQSLKSSKGEEGWLRFFALMGSAIARIEGTPLIPGAPEDEVQLRDEIALLASQLDVLNRLEAFAETLHLMEDDGLRAKYYVLELDVAPEQALLTVRSFDDQLSASDHFATMERLAEEKSSLDVVMVSVGVLTSLRRAYPNYYLDTRAFREVLSTYLSPAGE